VKVSLHLTQASGKQVSAGYLSAPVVYSEVWFNTPRLASVHLKHSLQKFGIKPDGIMNNRRVSPAVSTKFFVV
jgi:hypothetical protein